MKDNTMKIFLVDDDALFLKSLEIRFLLRSDFIVETYATGELCMKNIKGKPDVIVLDYFLNGTVTNAMNGIQTLDRIKHENPDIKVVMLSQQDQIEVAINCMHHHASDYVVKGETAFIQLQNIINGLSEFKKIQNQLSWYMNRTG